MPADEEARAVEYRRMMDARAAWTYQQAFTARPGSSAARVALDANWAATLPMPADGWQPVFPPEAPVNAPRPRRGYGAEVA